MCLPASPQTSTTSRTNHPSTNPPRDRHQWRRTQHPLAPLILYGPQVYSRCKKKRLLITCSPRMLKKHQRWRNFLQDRKPTEKRGFGLLSHMIDASHPIAAHPIGVCGQQMDFCEVDRTDLLQHVQNSPLFWSNFGKKNMWGSKCGFRGRSCKVSFPPRTSIHEIHLYGS